MKIGTHNSATGEKGKGFLSFLVAIFSKCQSKSIAKQYAYGCRFFDLRVKLYNKKWVCAHGLWTAKPSLKSILEKINSFGKCYVMITYEGHAPSYFTKVTDMWVKMYPNIIFTNVNEKKPYWRNITNYRVIAYNSEFKCLDGSSWHTYLPIPWLWKKIYHNKVEFNDKFYKMVDFL